MVHHHFLEQSRSCRKMVFGKQFVAPTLILMTLLSFASIWGFQEQTERSETHRLAKSHSCLSTGLCFWCDPVVFLCSFSCELLSDRRCCTVSRCCELLRVNDRALDHSTLLYSDDLMTIDYCKNHCKNLTTGNYSYAGVEFGIECFCGTLEEHYARHGQGMDADCRSACAGNPYESCGGSGFIAIFDISLPVTTESSDVTTSQDIVTSATYISPTSFRRSDATTTTTTHTGDMLTSTTETTTETTTTQCYHTGLYAAIGVETVIIIALVAADLAYFILQRRSGSKHPDEIKCSELESAHAPSGSSGNKDNGYYQELSITQTVPPGSAGKQEGLGLYQELSDIGGSPKQDEKQVHDDHVYYSAQI